MVDVRLDTQKRQAQAQNTNNKLNEENPPKENALSYMLSGKGLVKYMDDSDNNPEKLIGKTGDRTALNSMLRGQGYVGYLKDEADNKIPKKETAKNPEDNTEKKENKGLWNHIIRGEGVVGWLKDKKEAETKAKDAEKPAEKDTSKGTFEEAMLGKKYTVKPDKAEEKPAQTKVPEGTFEKAILGKKYTVNPDKPKEKNPAEGAFDEAILGQKDPTKKTDAKKDDKPIDIKRDPVGNNYNVQKGDCLWNIAKRSLSENNKSVDNTAIANLVNQIAQANNIKNPDLIYPDQKLSIPVQNVKSEDEKKKEAPVEQTKEKPVDKAFRESVKI